MCLVFSCFLTVRRKEMVLGVVGTFKDHRSLAHTLQDSEHIARKLGLIIMGAILFILFVSDTKTLMSADVRLFVDNESTRATEWGRWKHLREVWYWFRCFQLSAVEVPYKAIILSLIFLIGTSCAKNCQT